jgi:SAM-dependent methyltransferase
MTSEGIDPLAGVVNVDRTLRGEEGETSVSPKPMVCGIGEHLPFRSSTIDVVLSVNCIDHGQSPARIVMEMSRVLRGNGRLILMVHCVGKPTRFLHRVLHENRLQAYLLSGRRTSVLLRDAFSRYSNAIWGWDILKDGVEHPHYLTYSDILQFVADSGLRLVESWIEKSDFGYKDEFYIVAERAQPSAFDI